VQLLEQLAHAGVLDDPAVIDDADVAAQLLGLLQIMGGEDDGDALLVEFGEKAPHRAAQLDIDPGGRLIEDQQSRLMNQGASDHQAPLHAAGQLARGHIALVPQPQLVEVLLGTLLGDARGNPVITGLGHDDVEDLLELVEVELLGHHTQATLERRRLLVQVMAEHVDRAAGLGHQGRENADGGGFAGAIGAEQCEKIPFGDIQVDAMQRLEAIAVGFGQLPDGQSGTHKKCTHL